MCDSIDTSQPDRLYTTTQKEKTMQNTTTLMVLNNLENLDLYGISYSDWQDARFTPGSYHIADRSNIVTTFRFRDLLGGWNTCRFYGKADSAQIKVVADWAASEGLHVEYLVTSWGRPMVQLGGLDWKGVA